MIEKYKILVIDDDPVIGKQMQAQLERNYFDALIAANGRAALDILKKEKVDILFMDVKLPDIDGLDLLNQIKEEYPHCEVIIITGYGNLEIAIKALRRGAIDYLEKPIKNDMLNSALGRAQEKIVEKNKSSHKNTLLIVDDEKEAAFYLTKFLSREGFEVFEANSGKEALEVIEKNRIDVVVTDINLGDMNGIEVLRQAKGFYKDIEGLMVTGEGNQALAIKALRAGALDYITKPVDLEELLISITKAIEKINLHRNSLFRNRELEISSEIISKMNEELEHKIEERTKELGQMQSQLFQTSKLATLGEMAAGLAHEINQPLTGISLIATTMGKLADRNKLAPDIILELVADMNFSVKRMSEIIKHVRTFARQESQKFIEVDLNQTVKNTLGLLTEQLRAHGIEPIIDLSDELPKINGEPFQLEQVWINLISNARDAMDQRESSESDSGYEKKLSISTSLLDDGKKVTIDFTDNGSGIPEDKMQKILEPFFTTKEVGSGTGLGLSISYGIITSHHGEIGIESKEGEGTTMSVVLPV